MPVNIILASASPYRAALLRQLNLSFVQRPAQIDETPYLSEAPGPLALRLAEQKAMSLVAEHPNSIIIGSDQTGICNNQLLHKPGNQSMAIQQLAAMSGQIAFFYTATTVVQTDNTGVVSAHTDIDTTELQLRHLTNEEIRAYVAADLPLDCAGSFKIESLGISLFSSVKTVDPSALQGISLIQLTNRLKQLGIKFGAHSTKH